MMNYYYGAHMVRPMNPGFGIFGWIIGIIFWVLLICLIVGLIRHFVSNREESEDSGESSNRALEILKERYAKGEISHQEFDKIKKDIA
jgi:putative membrane protein